MAPRAGSRRQEPGLGVGGKGVSMGSWHGMSWKAWVPTGKPQAQGSGPQRGRQAALKGTSRRLSPSRKPGEGDVQRASPALLAEQASGYLAQSPKAVFLFGSIRLQSKHWQIGIPTWALTNSNRPGHNFQLICLGQKCSALPRPGCGKQDPSHYPLGLGSSRAVPRWLFHLHLGSLVVW